MHKAGNPALENLFELLALKKAAHEMRNKPLVGGRSQFTLTKIDLFFTPYPPLVDMR